MNYKEFCEKSGKLSDPDNFPELMESQNSVHVIIVIGTILNEGFRPYEVTEIHKQILSCIDSLESRGAVREKDYIITCWSQGPFVSFGLHSTREFISQEDFPSIKNVRDNRGVQS